MFVTFSTLSTDLVVLLGFRTLEGKNAYFKSFFLLVLGQSIFLIILIYIEKCSSKATQ